MQGLISNTSRLALGAVLGASLIIQGCANTAALTAKYDDPADQCVESRRPIIDLRSTEQQEQIQSTAAGAAVGALLTGGVALLSGDDSWWQKALIGGAVGALAGYSRAYFQQKAEKNTTRTQLLSSVDADARAERQQLTRTARAVDALRDCRSDALRQVQRDFERKQISKEIARAKIEEIQAAAAVDNRLVNEVLDGADERVSAYVDTTAVAAEVDANMLAAERRDREARAAKRKVRNTSPNVIRASDQASDVRIQDEEAQAQFNDRLQAMLIATG